MKKLWVALFVLFLLPALYSVERPAERMEDVRPPARGFDPEPD